MPDALINGTRLYYRIDGDENAPPLLLCNSLGTNLHMWDAQVDEFSKHFQIIRYDRRGHGKSSVPDGPYSFEMLTNDALGLLDFLNIKKVHFCGLSMGGMVGQRLGSLHPDRVEKIVLCNTSSHLPPENVWQERAEIALLHGTKSMVKNIIDRWFTKDFQNHNPSETERITNMVKNTADMGYAACCMAIRDMDHRNLLPQISVPTLVVIGKHDGSTSPEMGDFLVTNIPGAKKLNLNAAHLSNIEEANKFNNGVLNFLL